MITAELSPLLNEYVESRFRPDYYWQDDDNYIQVIDSAGEAKANERMRLVADRQEEKERATAFDESLRAELNATKINISNELVPFVIADPGLVAKLHAKMQLLAEDGTQLKLEMFSGLKESVNKLFRHEAGNNGQWLNVELANPLVQFANAEQSVVMLVRSTGNQITTYVHDMDNGSYLHLNLSNPETRRDQIDTVIRVLAQAGETQLKFAADTESAPYSKDLLQTLVERVNAHNALAKTRNYETMSLVCSDASSPAGKMLVALSNSLEEQVPQHNVFDNLEHDMQVVLSNGLTSLSPITPQPTPLSNNSDKDEDAERSKSKQEKEQPGLFNSQQQQELKPDVIGSLDPAVPQQSQADGEPQGWMVKAVEAVLGLGKQDKTEKDQKSEELRGTMSLKFTPRSSSRDS